MNEAVQEAPPVLKRRGRRPKSFVRVEPLEAMPLDVGQALGQVSVDPKWLAEFVVRLMSLR